MTSTSTPWVSISRSTARVSEVALTMVKYSTPSACICSTTGLKLVSPKARASSTTYSKPASAVQPSTICWPRTEAAGRSV
jgi:hypothetical protein